MLLYETNYWDTRNEPIEIQDGLFIAYSETAGEYLISFLDDQQNTIYSFPANSEPDRNQLRILKNESVVYCISTIWDQTAHTLRDKAVIASDIITFSETGVPRKIELGEQEYALLIRGSDLYYYYKKKIYRKPLNGGEATLLTTLQVPILEDEDNYFRRIQFVYDSNQVEIYVSTDSLGSQENATRVLLDAVFFE